MPPSLESRPVLPDHLSLAYTCFKRLRKLTVEAGVISFQDVMCYAERIGIHDVDAQLEFYDVVKACDVERLIILAQKQSESQSGG